jgi:hypothetical protein
MGNSMTTQMPVAPKWAELNDVAPPKAPLLMPTQVLQSGEGIIARALAPLAATMNLFKHSFRRAG